MAGEAPLFLSALFGRTAATTYLLNHGADPMLVTKSLVGSPLHGAAVKVFPLSLMLLVVHYSKFCTDSVKPYRTHLL